MRLYCARCQHAAIPLNINCAQVYACPQCGAVYVHRGSNIYSFRDLGADYFDGFYREHKIRSYLKRLQALGWEPNASPASI